MIKKGLILLIFFIFASGVIALDDVTIYISRSDIEMNITEKAVLLTNESNDSDNTTEEGGVIEGEEDAAEKDSITPVKDEEEKDEDKEVVTTVEDKATDEEETKEVTEKESLLSVVNGSIVSAVNWSYRNPIIRSGVPVFVVLVVVLIYIFNRDSDSNNLRKARKHHKLSECYHNRGKEDKSQKHYELAQLFRERGAR